MSIHQTTASGDGLTLLLQAGDQLVTRRQAESWLRQRQAAKTAITVNQRESLAS